MILKRKYDLDVVPGGMPKIIRVSKNDSSSELVFSLYAGRGKLDVPESTTAKIRGKVIPDGVSCGFSITNNIPTVTVDLTKEMTGQKGKKPFELVLTAADGVTNRTLVSATFLFDIR